jgi:hypothetical protein
VGILRNQGGLILERGYAQAFSERWSVLIAGVIKHCVAHRADEKRETRLQRILATRNKGKQFRIGFADKSGICPVI